MENNFLTIEHKTVSSDEFLRTQPVHCQRQIDHRLRGISKVLTEKLLPTHLEVSLIKVNFTDNYYEKGKSYSINGNTRKEIWSNDSLIKPDFLYITYYFANNRKEVEEIYNSIDSSKSVENTADKISGLYRTHKFVPKSHKFKTRTINRACETAYACYNNAMYYRPSILEIKNAKEFDFFRDELEVLDTHYVMFNTDKTKSKKFTTTNIMSALLIIGKKYGVNHPRYSLMLHNLFNEIAIRKEGVTGLNDGVSVVWGNLYDKHQDREWTMSGESDAPKMIAKILYCLDAFMNDIDISIKGNTSIKGIVMNDDKSKDYFKTYITSIV
jgi:hypothetical protein